MTYRIIRFYMNSGNVVLKTNLTLDEAQDHCSDPETSSSTCTNYRGTKRTECMGPWFDGYEQE